MRIARWWSLLFGIVITFGALFVSKLGSLIEAPIKIAGFLGGPLLGVFLLGVFSSRANAKGTLLGTIVGSVVVIGGGWFTSVSFTWYALVGAVTTYLVGDAASLLLRLPTRRNYDSPTPEGFVGRQLLPITERH